MSLRQIGWVVWFAGLLSCAPADHAETGAVRRAAGVGKRSMALSVQLEVEGEFVPGQPLPLVLALSRRGGAALQGMRVRVQLPQGVELLRGAAETELPACHEACVDRLAYALRAPFQPGADLVFEIDAQGARAGLHAQLRHRFGRAEPVPAPVAPSGPALRVGAHDWGRSIVLTPEPAAAR